MRLVTELTNEVLSRFVRDEHDLMLLAVCVWLNWRPV